jgi:hypothetical protein
MNCAPSGDAFHRLDHRRRADLLRAPAADVDQDELTRRVVT